TIGPYEVYEDKLKAAKAAFESFVTVSDPVESKKLAKHKALLPQMEQNLHRFPRVQKAIASPTSRRGNTLACVLAYPRPTSPARIFLAA
ncbi:MAG: hypothetical protein AAGA56_21885, partial [Myxococcota bacterium]